MPPRCVTEIKLIKILNELHTCFCLQMQAQLVPEAISAASGTLVPAGPATSQGDPLAPGTVSQSFEPVREPRMSVIWKDFSQCFLPFAPASLL